MRMASPREWVNVVGERRMKGNNEFYRSLRTGPTESCVGRRRNENGRRRTSASRGPCKVCYLIF